MARIRVGRFWFADLVFEIAQRGCGRRSQESGDRIQEFLSAERVKGFGGKRRRVAKNLCAVRRNRRVVAQGMAGMGIQRDTGREILVSGFDI